MMEELTHKKIIDFGFHKVNEIVGNSAIFGCSFYKDNESGLIITDYDFSINGRITPGNLFIYGNDFRRCVKFDLLLLMQISKEQFKRILEPFF